MKFLISLLALAGLLYLAVCVLLYFKQERLLFFPEKLASNYRFPFKGSFQERWVEATDGTRLHGLLFLADSSKGLLFYLHGNGGALDSWGEVASVYTQLGYDVFLLDYRGYGKSGGQIQSQTQFLGDVETAYQQLLAEYPESRVVLLGYSLGTGAAAWLAAHHQPKLLILQAPYPSMRAMARHYYFWIPGFIVRYPLATDQVLPRVKAPVIVFHGDQDEIIDYQLTLQLKAALKPQDQFITLKGAGHNNMTNNAVYQETVQRILSR